MLAELRIKNFVLIEDSHIKFSSGLNIISGETGAGKSIILDALNLLVGGKASVEMLRDGADESSVEGLFYVSDEPWLQPVLEEFGLHDDEIWIKRLIPKNGRSRVFLNGLPVSLIVLQNLGRRLLDFSNQNEHQVLLDSSTHIDVLDAYADILDLRCEMKKIVLNLTELIREKEKLEKDQVLFAEKEAFYKFQIAEIERASLLLGEEDELEREKKILSHSEKIFASMHWIELNLFQNRHSAIDLISDAVKKLRDLVDIDNSLEKMNSSLESALFLLEDLSRDISNYSRNIQFNPSRLEAIQSRISDLSQFKRKYKLDIAGILAKYHDMKNELSKIESSDGILADLNKKMDMAYKNSENIGLQLLEKRKSAALALQSLMLDELKTLSMPKANFEVRIDSDLNSNSREKKVPSTTGYDSVSFYFSANPGESLKPLAKVASGGELSRLLLALKHGLASVGEVGTFVFDEIDTGMGGAVGEVVGRKLKSIASNRQLLCITHLAQIAVFADRHFSVEKYVNDGRTFTKVSLLEGDAEIEEISRMLGGIEITEKIREHARELLQRCK